MQAPTAMYLLAALGAVALPFVTAASNGMDMSMDDAMSLAQGEMLTHLHFTPGDTLWFLGWVPASTGAMVGACIGLFLLALVERWIAAGRAVIEVHWSRSAQAIVHNRQSHYGPLASPGDSKTQPATTPSFLPCRSIIRSFPPFIFAHDVPRGVVFVAQSLLNFAFMLAVMTFQLGFIIALIVGLGVGEALFGRYASHTTAHLV